jgi:hypothetical protein
MEKLKILTIFQCGKKNCTHKWDGPIWKSEDGRSESVTCSKCGVVSLHESFLCGE